MGYNPNTCETLLEQIIEILFGKEVSSMGEMVSHTIEIKMNKTMRRYLDQCFGYNRYCWNKMLAENNRRQEANEKYKFNDLSKYLHATQEEWESEMPSEIRVRSFQNLYKSFKRMWNGLAKYPNFKRKHSLQQSFKYSTEDGKRIIWNDDYTKFKINCGRKFKFPQKYRWFKLTEQIGFKGTIKEICFFKKADRYFANFQIQLNQARGQTTATGIVGIDLGLKTYATLSDKTTYNLPKKKLKKLEKKAVFYQKIISRKYKQGQARQSNKYLKTKAKFNKLWWRITCLRKEFLHQTTTDICRNFKTIVVETLRPLNMMKNRKLAKQIQDACWGMFIEMLRYKSASHGNIFIQVDTFYPSTQLCNCCGHRLEGSNKLKLQDRIYKCPNCGHEEDRDINAAKNLQLYGSRMLAGLQPSWRTWES